MRLDWVKPASAVVCLVTVLRWMLLAFDHTDLFVDEAQYWLWGQDFAFGYYSKPPLIAWLIGSVTTLAHSDSPFWVRMPGASLHGATAMILGAVTARLHSPHAAFWVSVTYVTLPFVALGGLMISTDTVMAPFFAAALLFHLRQLESRRWQDALLAGLMIGLACLAKYAGLYFVLGAVLSAVLHRDMRPSGRNWLVMLAGLAAMLAPNILWNQAHQFSTLSHTMDNVGWVEHGSPLTGLNLTNALAFIAGQFGVFGPITLMALIIALARRRTLKLASFVLPVLLIVTVQALLNNAYANWALSAFFAGTIVAGVTLLDSPRWRTASFVINGLICLALPILTVFPDLGPPGKPLLARYLGRAEMSRALIRLAQEQNIKAVVVSDRDVIADLFYTGRDANLAFYTPRFRGRPANHYEQTYPVPESLTDLVLYVAGRPPDCTAAPLTLPKTGAYAKAHLSAYIIPASCLPTGT